MLLPYRTFGVALIAVGIAACGGGDDAGSASAGNGGDGGVAGSGDGGAGGSGDGSTSGGDGGTPVIPPDLVDPSRITAWNPGILSDDQLHLPLGDDRLPVRTTVCASPAPGADLNAALSACPDGQVVQLAAGTYTISSTVTLTKGVVLRGAGSGAGGTTIVMTGGGSVLAIGTDQDQTCYGGSMGTPYPLTKDALKETSTIQIGANASQFSPGDLALVDQLDDTSVNEGDGTYFKRVPGRSITERVEIASVDTANGTLTLSSPLHWTFQSSSTYQAMIAKASQPAVKWAGIESVSLQGGTSPDYDGQRAGGIDVSNAAYSWVKDVQTDGTIGGMHIAVTGTYRFVVRDSYFHNSANYGFGADCYGIVLRCGSADGLVENNIARFMNKPILFNVSGGGNVVGYNYADNSWATPAAWQEVNIDSHCSFPHMELMEGNYAPHMGASITHGNAGYFTFFRNYASSQFAGPQPVYGSTATQSGNMTALEFDTSDVNMNVIGNVLGSASANNLGTAPLSSAYTSADSSTASIFEVDTSDVAFTSLWAHGNYDTVTPGVVWNSKSAVRTLPPSFYLTSKPGWWPSASAWPWTGSDLTPMVGTLPAKARADAM